MPIVVHVLASQVVVTDLAAPMLMAEPVCQQSVAGSRVSFQQNQSGNSLSGAKKVCDKIWPKLQLKVLFMAKFALNKSC